MTIEEIFRHAIIGGLKEAEGHQFIKASTYWVIWLDRNGARYNISTSIYFLNPVFWQCLGRAFGWNVVMGADFKQEEWLFRWHLFIDHLAEGKTPTEYFNLLGK